MPKQSLRVIRGRLLKEPVKPSEKYEGIDPSEPFQRFLPQRLPRRGALAPSRHPLSRAAACFSSACRKTYTSSMGPRQRPPRQELNAGDLTDLLQSQCQQVIVNKSSASKTLPKCPRWGSWTDWGQGKTSRYDCVSGDARLTRPPLGHKDNDKKSPIVRMPRTRTMSEYSSEHDSDVSSETVCDDKQPSPISDRRRESKPLAADDPRGMRQAPAHIASGVNLSSSESEQLTHSVRENLCSYDERGPECETQCEDELSVGTRRRLIVGSPEQDTRLTMQDRSDDELNKVYAHFGKLSPDAAMISHEEQMLQHLSKSCGKSVLELEDAADVFHDYAIEGLVTGPAVIEDLVSHFKRCAQLCDSTASSEADAVAFHALLGDDPGRGVTFPELYTWYHHHFEGNEQLDTG